MRQPPYEWVSVAEAARRLGLSVSTVRRMVEDGKLVGEREPLGGKRERFRVRMTHQDASPSESSNAPPDASEPLTNASPLISGLLEIISADRETIQQQAAEIRALAERVGRSEAERDRLQAELDRERRPWWRKIWGE